MTDVRVVARRCGHSVPRTHTGQERFFNYDHHLFTLLQMGENVLVGSWTCPYVDNASFTWCSMWCLMTLARPTDSQAKWKLWSSHS